MKSESVIKNEIIKKLGSDPDYLIWNNPTGTGKSMTPPYQVIKFGLKGSPDIIGCVKTTITPDMVGKQIGVALGVEVKTEIGRQRPEQISFQRAWEMRGGIYILARSHENLKEEIRGKY